MAEQRRNAPRLRNAEDDREVARNLGELLATRLAFLLELLKRGDDRAKELDYDLRRNVGPDREEADGALPERTAGEHFEPVEHAAAGVFTSQVADYALKRLPVNAWRRNLRNKTAHEHEAERNQDFLPKLRDAECVRKSLHHRHFLSLFPSTLRKLLYIISKISRPFQGHAALLFS